MIFDPEAPDSRTRLLLGDDNMERLRNARIIIFGVGGVGSWCAEALARTGVGNITLVDSDTVAPSNINRQLVADFSTIGQIKVDVMARRIHLVSPDCRVTAIADIYSEANSASYNLDSYDIIVDAIDSLQHKAHLILAATACRHARLVSSMGAALKTDITRIAVAPFDKVYGCPLARALRQRFKRNGTHPRRRFNCVYSPELTENALDLPPAQTANGVKRINGTLMPTTASFGLMLAQLVVSQLTRP